MADYANMKTVTYSLGSINFATGSTVKLKVPRGAQMARVLDIFLTCTVNFTQVTTPAQVEIGDGTNAGAFANLVVGGLTAGNTLGASDVTNGIFTAVYDAGAYPNPLHDLIATLVAPTGGTPAGTAAVTVVVGYDQIEA